MIFPISFNSFFNFIFILNIVVLNMFSLVSGLHSLHRLFIYFLSGCHVLIFLFKWLPIPCLLYRFYSSKMWFTLFYLVIVVQDFCEFEDEKVEQANFFRRKLIQSYNLVFWWVALLKITFLYNHSSCFLGKDILRR